MMNKDDYAHEIFPVVTGDGDPRLTIEIDGDGDIDLTFLDGLEWHDEYLGVTVSPLTHDIGAIRALVVNGNPGLKDRVDVDWFPVDGGGIVATLFCGNVSDYANIDEVTETTISWDFIARMINITDPGTFNTPYIFGVETERN